MKQILLIALLFSLVAGITSCDNKRNKEINPEAEFFKIYDDQKYSESYYPIDIKAVSDGYLIYGKRRITSSAYYGVFTLKIDKEGNFVSQNFVDEQYVNPLPNLMKIGGNFYFVCMDATSLHPKIMQIANSGKVTEAGEDATALLPVAVSSDGSELVLLSYDKDELQMEVRKMNTSGVLSGFEEFEIGYGDLDIEELVIDHLTGNGPPLPFMTGSLNNGTYYYNGYYTYNFNTVFFSFGGNSVGLLQGYRNERMVSSLMYQNSGFAASWVENGTHYVKPNATIATNAGSLAGVSSLEGNLLLEFHPDYLPKLTSLRASGKDLVVMGGTSKSNEINLYLYNKSGGGFLASLNLGYSHAYEYGAVESTEDGGLLVCGMILIEGRFPRICVFKLSEEQLNDKLNPDSDK